MASLLTGDPPQAMKSPALNRYTVRPPGAAVATHGAQLRGSDLDKKAVQFGAGNIGRGFLGQLFFETGYHTTFVDVVDGLIEALNRRGAYPLRLVDDEHAETMTIGHVAALDAADADAVAEALAGADFAATAVGVAVLPQVAPLIAAGVARRFQDGEARPLNIIVCENMIHAGPHLRGLVREHLDPSLHGALEDRVGFVEASIGRMVPVMTDKERAEDPLLVCVEPYCDLPVDAQGFIGDPPPLEHMRPYPRFEAYVERKLFLHNAGHAVTAYLGHLRGHEYIWQAIADSRVRGEVDAAMAETRAALAAKHCLDRQGLDEHWRDLVRRFQNRALGDQVARVCKDPLRKLGPRDRLIGAARMCLEQSIDPAHVAFAAAAAIRYDIPSDEAARTLGTIRERDGLEGVFRSVCRIDPGSVLAERITEGMRRLEREGWTN